MDGMNVDLNKRQILTAVTSNHLDCDMSCKATHPICRVCRGQARGSPYDSACCQGKKRNGGKKPLFIAAKAWIKSADRPIKDVYLKSFLIW